MSVEPRPRGDTESTHRFAFSRSWSQGRTESTLPKPGGWGRGRRQWEMNEGGKVGGAGLEASLGG